LAAGRNSKLVDDPLLKVTFDLLAAKSPAEKSAVISHGLGTEDPLLIRTLIMPQPSPGDDYSVELMGKKYEGEHGKQLIVHAFDLLDCDLGMDRGRSSTRALQLCTEDGWCGESVTASLKDGFGHDGGLQFEQSKHSQGSYLLL
jgi:hypothetical protein